MLTATDDEAIAVMLGVAPGTVSIDDLTDWLGARTLRIHRGD